MRARLRFLATLIGIVGTTAVAIWCLFHLTGDPPKGHEPITIAPAPLPSARPSPTPTPSPSPSADASVGVGVGDTASAHDAGLGSARATVDTQLMLLREGRDADFRATFLPTVAVTPEAIAACRRRIDQVPVKPDWEVAEDVVIDGHAVRRVSMFGKSMTGFHELSGRWLADAVWCVPTGLP